MSILDTTLSGSTVQSIVSPDSDFRAILRFEFESRCRSNPSYSFRAFSRDLDVSSGALNEILSGKRGLSSGKAKAIAEKIGLNPKEKDVFVDLVVSACSRNKSTQRIAKTRLEKHRDRSSSALAEDIFIMISEWYFGALMELTKVKGFKNDIDWISKKFDVPANDIKEAIIRLKRIGLLKENDDRLVPSNDFLSSPDGIPSESLKRFHTTMLQKATASIREQTVDQRELGAMILPFRASQLKDAKLKLKEFCRSFSRGFDPKNQADSVYALSFQFYRLDRETGEES